MMGSIPTAQTQLNRLYRKQENVPISHPDKSSSYTAQAYIIIHQHSDRLQLKQQKKFSKSKKKNKKLPLGINNFAYLVQWLLTNVVLRLLSE